ncbi:MAG: tetratricopeptide repeat protein [Gemmatimonadetes bacterium]|nr:tetratricopeptide repeat protein [Gemmatimonadota bacterium]
MDPTFFRKFRKRHIAEWGIGYLAVAGGTMQVLDILGNRFGWPDEWVRALFALLGVGFLVVLVLAWFHGERGRQQVTGLEVALLAVLAGVAVAAVAILVNAPPARSERPVEPASLARAEAAAADRSIAVLPFVDLSPAHDQEYFSDGVTEEILNTLAQVRGLRVAARTSAFAFKGKDVPVDRIGQELHVAHVLEGSVRKDGNRLRITAQLVNTTSGYQLWTKTYELELGDVFAVQEEIARSITQALRITLSGQASIPPSARTRPEAYDLFFRGLQALNRRTPADLRQAIDYFEQAIALDSLYAQAHAGLAMAEVLLPVFGAAPAREAMPRAREAARAALELDNSLPEAHAALALVEILYDWNWPGAETEFRRTLQSSPSFATGHHWYGLSMMLAAGRADRALEELRTADGLDPLSYIIDADVGQYYVLVRDYERALRQLGAVLETAPDFPEALYWSGYAHLGAGRPADAARAWARVPEMAGLRDSADVATVMAGIADRPRRSAALAVLRRRAAQPHPALVDLAAQLALLGAREDALRLLERAARERDFHILYVRHLAAFDGLRDDPRLRRLLEALPPLEAAPAQPAQPAAAGAR